jgi:hypothetical protein
MKRSPLALVSLIAGIMVLVPAALILVIDGLGLGESHPLAVAAFPIILIFSLPEAPIQAFNVPFSFPIVVPLVSYLCAVASIARKESKKKLAITGIVLTTISLAILALI